MKRESPNWKVKKKGKNNPNCPSLCKSWTAAGTARFRNVSCYTISGSSGGFYEIDLNRLHLFIQPGVNCKLDSTFLKNLIVFLRLIQSHAQWGPRSPTLGEIDPNGWDRFAILEMFFDCSWCLLGYLEHPLPPVGIQPVKLSPFAISIFILSNFTGIPKIILTF